MSMCIIVSILCDSAIEKVDDNKEYRKKISREGGILLSYGRKDRKIASKLINNDVISLVIQRVNNYDPQVLQMNSTKHFSFLSFDICSYFTLFLFFFCYFLQNGFSNLMTASCNFE